MDIAFLCGGEGTRLRPLTYVVPKPMLPIGSKPILEINITRAKEQGFRRFFLLLSYKSDVIRSYFGSGESLGVEILYFEEDSRRGTAGPLLPLRNLVSNPLVVMNADLLTEINLKALSRFHKSNDADLSIALKRYEIRMPYGVIRIDEANVVTDVREKPTIELLINTGIYTLSPTVIEIIPENGVYSMIDLLGDARNKGLKIMGYKFDESWRDVGGIDDYLSAFRENQSSQDDNQLGFKF